MRGVASGRDVGTSAKGNQPNPISYLEKVPWVESLKTGLFQPEKGKLTDHCGQD